LFSSIVQFEALLQHAAMSFLLAAVQPSSETLTDFPAARKGANPLKL
jgi:hypothetical protein